MKKITRTALAEAHRLTLGIGPDYNGTHRVALNVARCDECETERDGMDHLAPAWWSAEDLAETPGGYRHTGTEAERAEWLIDNAGAIQDAMVEAGWDAIEALASGPEWESIVED